jgi:peptidoglycan/LPS O-acetylase OafA/YrhL
MITRNNNFDILRLLAAIIVFLEHGISHLHVSSLIKFSKVLSNFPGVLIFFTISGFLIFSSFDRNKNLKRYFFYRFLRLFPALWLCFIFTLGLILYFNIISLSDIYSWTMIKWIFTQITVFQFWTPDVLRSWGVGTPNGSLWTIPVEIQFYILLPVIVIVQKKITLAYKFYFFILISLGFNFYLATNQNSPETVYIKLLAVSILPYFYSFLTGSIIYLFWNKIKNLLENKLIFWLIIYLFFNFIFNTNPSYTPIGFQLISNLLLSILTISFAFSFRNISVFLMGNDISYGMYIYHMLVINSFVSIGYVGEVIYLLMAFMITLFLSILSWFLIEKKALQLKKYFK